ncbi:hypothetical protein ACFWNK_10750 [Streptomyces sp. NPDC058417]|uniref:hypothetical protein n=1 Tax=unclassified Streptomyces TaxID=2593676 RepID=UPI00364BB023
MAITDDLRKTLSDPTPLYFAAGTADLALQQALKLPGLVEQLRAEAPARFEAVRNTDPKDVQERAASRAKEAGSKAREAQETLQAKVNGFIANLDGDFKKIGTNLDSDLKKLGESAQDLALRSVGVAAEYAVKARETYEKVAEHGEQAVRTWRGGAAEEIEELAIVVEGKDDPKPAAAKPAAAPKPTPRPTAVVTEPKPAPAAKKTPATPAAAKKAPAPRKSATAKSTAAKPTAAAPRPTAKKTTPPAK